MCQTYANFPCTSVINYRSEAGKGSKESTRARVPVSVHCAVSACRCVFCFLLMKWCCALLDNHEKKRGFYWLHFMSLKQQWNILMGWMWLKVVWSIQKWNFGFCRRLPVTQPVTKPHERLKLSVVIKVRILAMFCFYSFFSSTPSLSSAWLPLYMLSMSDPAVTTNYLEGLQASLLILTTALFLLKA